MIILTVDYEVFGNGSGCPAACIIKPADRMLAIANEFQVPITFFVESLELMEMEKVGVSTANAIKEQIRSAVKSGHDVQLHLHPQWEDSKYLSDGRWELNMMRWRIGDLPAEKVGELLRIGVDWLENVVKAVDASYRCLAFRAGGWCIQPSVNVLNEMKKIGILIDSTVAPGIRSVKRDEWSDFRNAPDKPYWKIDVDVCASSIDGLWELPIATAKINPFRHLQAVRNSRRAGDGGLSPGCSGSYQGPGGALQQIQGKLGKLSQVGRVMLDFSTMPTDVLIEVTKKWMDKFDDENANVPIVAIAHTKNFTAASEYALAGYLDWARDEEICIATFGQWLRKMNDSE